MKEVYENCKKNSINNKIEPLKVGKKVISNKILTGIISVTMVVGLVGCQPQNSISDLTLENHNLMYISNAKLDMDEYDILYVGENIDNSVDDYKKLSNLNEKNLIGYYCALNENKEECEKLVQVLGYNGWDDFLTSNGYVDNYGNPDINKWEKSAKEKNFYEDNDIKVKIK